jgi:hypothetical protein
MPATFPAEIFNKGGTDKTLILSPRTQMIYPFLATGWRDLRIGFLLSVTDETADDTITALGETIPVDPAGMGPQDRYWIGIKDRSTNMPKNPGSWFVGFTNASGEDNTFERQGDSALTSSDLGIGTTNANFWRPNNAFAPGRGGGIWQSFHPRANSLDGCQQHFAQNTAGAGGYATLLALRIRRPDKISKVITVTIPRMGLRSADVLFTNTPTLDLLQTNLRTFPTTVQQLGPVELSALPDALYCYWPFSNSRLRIHALGILRTA